MKILLASTQFVRAGYPYQFPQGIAYVASSLKQTSHEVHCLNLNHLDLSPSEAIAEAVRDIQPDVFGTGTLSFFMGQAREMLDSARRAKPDVVTVLGGGIFSAAPEDMLHMLDVDFGVIGEGEHAMVELANTLEAGRDPRRVNGIAFLDGNGEYVRTAARPPNKDLDSLPWPDYEGFELEKLLEVQSPHQGDLYQMVDDPREITIIASRSCPYSCTFCFHPNGRVYRQRRLDAVFAQLDHVIERHGVNLLFLADELFAYSKPRLNEFCERIKPYGIPWEAQLHTSIIDEDIVRAIRDAGGAFISLGLESMNPGVLVSMRKKAPRRQTEAAVEMVHRNRVGVIGNFIFGDAAESIETANDTLHWWASHRQYGILLGVLSVFPGSALYDHAVKEGRITQTEGTMPMGQINVSRLTDDECRRLKKSLVVLSSLPDPAWDVRYEKLVRQDSHGRDLYRITWRCPRCETENVTSNYPLRHRAVGRQVGVACRTCRSRWAVRNPLDLPRLDHQAEDSVRRAVALNAAGRENEANTVLTAIVEDGLADNGTENPSGAFFRALIELGKLCLGTEDRISEAIHYLGLAVYLQPFNPVAHLTLGLAFMKNSCTGAAGAHCAAARRLAGADDAELLGAIDAMDSMLRSQTIEGETPRYF